ncbi:unnamed protein product [Clonostachys chloroleuca]|uniref:Zn(2)-C6 fungal-type domain-containing protein n=1 Tax=Clonostachys chloroleuca TaxID=1926264 RepID=A0AA35QCK8_9HYPO|nr:unnamed protein product [Clonostachys chloroleuca]
MQLKRGIQRGSCDFCFRRKIKCDRTIRARQGHQSCSHCDLGHVPCRLDESDDVRIQKRKWPHPIDPKETRDATNNPPPITAQPPPFPSAQDAAALPSSFIPSGGSLSGPATAGSDYSNQSSAIDFELLDQLLGISSNSTSFLDQIFISPDQIQTLSVNNDEIGDNLLCDNCPRSHQHTSSSEAQCIDPNLFDDALHAYFDIAACSIPILFEDSFWEDFRSGQCSRALSSAVACRGVPFISTGLDNWDLQQRLARQFQDAILEAYNRPNSKGSVRLDDLEALALMAGFQYDPEYGLPLQSHLAKLFLGHDSLVLMMLQSEIQCHQEVSRNPVSSSEPLILAKANERRTLLFWHIYDLDAFHTLDCKTISRFRDDDTEIAEHLSPNKTEGYLDALLNLARIARKISQSLCGGSIKRLGIMIEDLELLYTDLQNWENSCPTHLQVPARVNADSLSRASDQRAHLRLAALRLLELNCYLQIDDCVSKFGLRSQNTLEGGIAALRVESETLRAAHGVLEVAQWAKDTRLRGSSGMSYSLIDAAPQMLRNICAGTLFRFCMRGQKPPRLYSSYLKNNSAPKQSEEEEDGTITLNNQHAQNYLDAAKSLREAVATARSHQDSNGRLAQLNHQIDLLQSHLKSR